MAAKNGGTTSTTRTGESTTASAATQVQAFVRTQVEEAQKRILAIEGEARKALDGLLEKGKESRKELEAFLKKFNAKDLKILENPTVKEIGKRAEAAGSELVKRLDSLQSRVIEVSGVASQSQIRQLNKEL